MYNFFSVEIKWSTMLILVMHKQSVLFLSWTIFLQDITVFRHPTFVHYPDVEVKNATGPTAYAFIQYDDIKAVVCALKHMDGEMIASNKVKLGFGKSMPTSCVWVDDIADNCTEQYFFRQFQRFGQVSYGVVDREECKGLVYYDNLDEAQRAVNEMRGRIISGKKIMVSNYVRWWKFIYLLLASGVI